MHLFSLGNINLVYCVCNLSRLALNLNKFKDCFAWVFQRKLSYNEGHKENREPVINTGVSTVCCRLFPADHNEFHLVFCPTSTLETLTEAARRHLQLLQVLHLGEGVRLDGHDGVITQISAERKERRKLGPLRSPHKDGSFFCRHQPCGAKATKTSIEWRKSLGSRTIKLCAAVCCINQERPNAGLLLSFGNGWEKTLIRIKCSCCTTIPNTHTFTHTDLSPLASVIDIVWHTCKDTNGRVFFLIPHQSGGMGEETNSLSVLVWFTLVSLQLGLLETISETRGRLTGAAARPGLRKTSWSPSGSGSSAEIWENNKSLINFQPHFWLGDLTLFVFH